MNNCKTAHELARELLAGPDLPIWHFDPSRAGVDQEIDTSLSVPTVETNDSRDGLDEETIADHEEEGAYMGKFITLCGVTDKGGEAKTDRECELEELLRSACAIADRKGEGTAWERFLASAANLGINGITARTYRVLPHELSESEKQDIRLSGMMQHVNEGLVEKHIKELEAQS